MGRYSESGNKFALRRRRSSRLLGTSAFSDPEKGSPFGLRRSLRLRSKSAMTVSQSTQMASRKRRKPRNPKPKCPPFWYQPGEIIFRGGCLAIPKYLRDQRQSDADYFRCAYGYGRTTSDRWDKIIGGNSKYLCCVYLSIFFIVFCSFCSDLLFCIYDMEERRFIVVSGKEHVFPNVGRSHGITWVGVHGINSICAVYLNKEPDMQRIIDSLGDSCMSYFTDYVLSEMEDIADSPPYSDKIGGKPFAVVSLPDYSNADEESRQKASAPSVSARGVAIALLEKKLTRHSAYGKRQIQLIAISAFQLLCRKELKAEEITVCCFYEKGNDYEIRELSNPKKNRRLAAINQ